MSEFYNDVVEGEKISPAWMNSVEDALGGSSVFSNGYPAQGATYTVFKDGSYYCARDGKTGKIDFDDTTFHTLMNEVILDMYDSAEGIGGTIDLKGPVFTATGQVNMRPGIYIRGSGLAGKLTGSLTGVWPLGTTIETGAVDTTVFSFDYPTPTTAHYFGGLSQMMIYGPEYDSLGTSTKPLIDLQCNSNYLSDVVLDHVYSAYGKYGLRILNGVAATYKIWNIWIDKCLFETNTGNGVLIDATSNQIIERVHINRCHFHGNNTTTGNGALEIDGHNTYASEVSGNTFDTEQKHSIYMLDQAHHWTLSHNVIKDGGAAVANTYDGVSLIDVDWITINGGNIGNISTANLKYAINSDNACTYCGFTGVTVNSATDPAIIQGTGAGMKTSNCPGYLNYNSGVTAAIASGTDIPHGLVSGGTGLTPTCVLAQCGTTGATGPWTDTLGAVNFKHNWVGGGNETVYWIAIYDP